MIIALAGNLGVGKDSVATEMMLQKGFHRTAFAKALKDLAGTLFDYNHETLWGPSELRNAPDERTSFDCYWFEVERRLHENPAVLEIIENLFPTDLRALAVDSLVNMIFGDFLDRKGTLTPRYILQRLGTEWGRKIYPEIWLHGVKRHIENIPEVPNWVITDCRFPDEAEFVIEKLSGKVIWIDASKRIISSHSHASEPYKEDLEPWITMVLDNNGTQEELKEKVKELLETIISKSA